MRLTLKNDGYPWRSIYRGRNRIGKVWQHAETKRFHGMIGKTEAMGSSFEDAFRNVAAKHMGFDSVDGLERNNREVRRKNSAMRAAGRYVADEMLRGNFEPFGKLLGVK
jgi:hypothetical protein